LQLLVALSWLDPAQFANMTNRSTTLDRLANFEVVDRCLSQKNVNYDDNLIPLIVTESRGAAASLLLRIKKAKEASLAPPVREKMKSTQSVRPKEFSRGALTDWGQDDFLVKTMEEVGTHNFNKLDESIHLRPFHEKQRANERDQTAREHKGKETREDFVRIRIKDKMELERSRARFMSEWIEEGRKSWKVNDEKRMEREKQMLRYELALDKRALARRENDRIKHAWEGAEYISSFERNMKRLGVGNDDGGSDGGAYRTSTESGMNFLQRIESKVGSANLVPESNFETMEILHGNEKVNAKARKERSTRRRKMVVDQAKAQEELEKRKAHEMMMEGMARVQRKQREIAGKEWEERVRRERDDRRVEEEIEEGRRRREEKSELKLREFFKITSEKQSSEEVLVLKQKTKEDIQRLKLAQKEKKRATATAVATAAVNKLLDLVDVIAGERAAVGGPIAPAFLRDAVRVYVGGEEFWEPEEEEEIEVFGWEEKGEGWWEWNIKGKYSKASLTDVEELENIDADVNITTVSFQKGSHTSAPLELESSSKHRALVLTTMAGMRRDTQSISNYMYWTLFEFASFLRRDDSEWSDICRLYSKRILSMPALDGTDLLEIEEVIDELEERLGDVSEARGDASRDVCDGSGGRANEWAREVTDSRRKKGRDMLRSIVEETMNKLSRVKDERRAFLWEIEEERKRKIEEEKRILEEEEAEKERERQLAEEDNGEEKKEASVVDEQKEKETRARELGLKIEEYEAKLLEEENERKRQEENDNMKREEEEKRRVQAEKELQKTMREKAASNLAGIDAICAKCCSQDNKWLNECVGDVLRLAVDECKNHVALYESEDDNVTSFNASCILLSSCLDLLRTNSLLDEFSGEVMGCIAELEKKLNEMCINRSQVENDAIADLATRVGRSASSNWKDRVEFDILIDATNRSVASDAIYPGTILDSRNNVVSLEFVRALVDRFKNVCKGKNMVSKEGFTKSLLRTLENTEKINGEKMSWVKDVEVVDKVVGRLLGSSSNNISEKINWKKFVQSLVCCVLPNVCTLENITKMKEDAHLHKNVVSVAKKPEYMGISREKFTAIEMWFEESAGADSMPANQGGREQRFVDSNTAREIKDIYATMFSESDETINFTEFLLCLSSVAEGNEHEFPLGFYRACVIVSDIGVIAGDREGSVLQPSATAPAGPKLTSSQIEVVLNNEVKDPIIPKNIFRDALALEGGGGDGEQKVSFTSVILTESWKNLGNGLYAICDVFA